MNEDGPINHITVFPLTHDKNTEDFHITKDIVVRDLSRHPLEAIAAGGGGAEAHLQLLGT
jgi:hypothetical protein